MGCTRLLGTAGRILDRQVCLRNWAFVNMRRRQVVHAGRYGRLAKVVFAAVMNSMLEI
jgi:hypothetical protein